ncbi:MAG: class I SAM-dependent methyltransferase [Candidatus Nanopelagicales bacterium]
MNEHENLAPIDFWEELYSGDRPNWSGLPNAVLADIAATFTPGRALDLGCGEGGDAVWLAKQGWAVTGIDISPRAIERARQAAEREGVAGGQCEFVAMDLATEFAAHTGAYELVTASFFQSPVELPRDEVLRTAAELVVPGGHLLITSHAGPPSWVPPGARQGPGHFVQPDEEVTALALDPASWMMVLAEKRSRPVTSPDGESGEIDDAVVLARRLTRE